MALPFLRGILLLGAVLLRNVPHAGAAVPPNAPFSGGLSRFLLREPGERSEADAVPSAFRPERRLPGIPSVFVDCAAPFTPGDRANPPAPIDGISLMV